MIDTDSDWLSAQLIVTPDEPGRIYQDPLYPQPRPQSPNPAFFEAFPSLEFDTYVSNGVVGEPVSITGAVDLGGPPDAIFNTDRISIAWYTYETDDIGTLALARFTLAHGAMGAWQLLASSGPAECARVRISCGGFRASGPVINGHMVPEPATLWLLALGALALFRRHRQPAK